MRANRKKETKAIRRARHLGAQIIVLWVGTLSAMAAAETVRDNFSSRQFDNNDGTVNWSGDWSEDDAETAGPIRGNVRITNGGELRLQDSPNTNTQPSLARGVNLSGASTATLSFDWRTTNGVDTNDSAVVEISSDGGSNWTVLENFTGFSGSNSGSRSYDIIGFAAATTQIRFRINANYGVNNETFRVDFVEIDYAVALNGSDLAITQTDSPDPVNVTSPMSYVLSVNNNGPDDATGVTVVDTLPAGVAFQSASATQGSCTQLGSIVTCTLGNMPASASATVNIALSAPFTVGTINNSATVSADQADPITTNNTSIESTLVQNLNVNQLCYLVADSGGSGGGNDLFTRIDTADFNPATNETNFGIGTGTSSIEAIAFNSATGIVYAANGGQLGTLNTATGAFQSLPQSFGTGTGSAGTFTFSDVDGLTYDATLGVLFGSHRRSGNDLLIQIDMTTGAHVPNAFGANVDYVQIQPVGGNTIIDDIAVDPTTGVMYTSTNNGGSTDRLGTINKTTGATTNIALITVPDIEGLGTDPSGQLWGTSGTQGILYEINKSTGVGTNGRVINNGSDYESVDCYAVSPSVSADLALSKVVDNITPLEGDSITYTLTVTNTGPGPATVVQLMDLLPLGVTYASATPSAGTYDPLSGDWFVGNLGVGSSANLILQATVDASTGGTTITNTVSVEFLSQIDGNAANDSASVSITPSGSMPALTVLKNATVVEDPVNGLSNPKAVPGATVRYQIGTINTGGGAADSDTLTVTDAIPTNTSLQVTDYDGSTSGPILFADGTISSALTYTFTSLSDPLDDVSFSNDDGVTFNYSPVATLDGTDPNVTHVRVNPKGTLAGDLGSGAPSFEVFFKAIVQ